MDEKEIKEPLDEATVEVNPEEILEGEEIADDLSERVAALEAELENEKKEYLFLRADFDNYRKRTLRDREELLRNAGEKVLAGLLPIADDFERGIDAASKAEDVNAVREGMELIYNKLIKFLADNGVTPMESTGKPFDADFHDAIASLPNDDPAKSGIVIDTTQCGYMINDKVLRHAKVAVAQ